VPAQAAPVQPQPEPEAARQIEPLAVSEPTPVRSEHLRLDEAENPSGGWARTGLAAGALIGAVVVLGALAGAWVGNGGDAQPEAGVTATLPPPTRMPVVGSPPAEPTLAAEVQPRRQRRVSAVPAPAPSPARAAARLAEVTSFVDSQPDENAAKSAVAEAPTVDAVASMPLPNPVIARTIERIGYACGQVASTSAVEGARGVYTVTCTSGASYQATPVRGRYRFRRVGSH
jgi:hypothetical protein